ncbi:MAG: hypothetical protein WC850_05085, partial [Candidatus Gracilibacteria bacterium]
NTRSTCTNYPDNASRNYTYTSDGGGVNSCTASYTPLCGLDLYESVEGTCSAVGVGYYSPNLNNTRSTCTNYPDNASRNYTYTSDGGGVNSCTASYTPLCGLDFYESVEGTCSAVGVGYYSPASNNTRYSCTTSPADNASRNYYYTTDGAGTNSCSYTYNPLCGVDLYESSVGVCSAVGVGYYSPNLNNTITACTNNIGVYTNKSAYQTSGGGWNHCGFFTAEVITGNCGYTGWYINQGKTCYQLGLYNCSSGGNCRDQWTTYYVY